MVKCESCEMLSGSLSSVEPHDALEMTGKNRIKAFGLASGHVELYRCIICGTELGRDCDRKDRGASWYVIKAAE